ncbi:MAG: cupredoxin domain-containing protein [Chloroflexi bacterium]|nr:cupredoxin domain-containing protein [Chloroflexota bacterium]
MRNLSFPKEIVVKAGAKVVFVIKNEGDETHSFELPDFKVLKEIKPGQTIRLEWTVPDKKGKWDMGCFLTDPGGVHDGMEGTLIIE